MKNLAAFLALVLCFGPLAAMAAPPAPAIAGDRCAESATRFDCNSEHP